MKKSRSRGYDSEEVSILPTEGLQPPRVGRFFCLMFSNEACILPFSCREDAGFVLSRIFCGGRRRACRLSNLFRVYFCSESSTYKEADHYGKQFRVLLPHPGHLRQRHRTARGRAGARIRRHPCPHCLRRQERRPLRCAGPGRKFSGRGWHFQLDAGRRRAEPPPRQGLRGHPHRQREQHRLPAGRGRRQRHRHGQGHRLRPGRAGKGRLGAVRTHPHGQQVPAGGQHPDHRGGGQRNIQQQRHHPGGHPPEAGLQRRHQPPEVRPHGPRAHQDPARLSDRVRLRRHHDAHHGALFHQWRQYGVDRRAGRGPAAHRDEERGHPPHRPGQLRAAGE